MSVYPGDGINAAIRVVQSVSDPVFKEEQSGSFIIENDCLYSSRFQYDRRSGKFASMDSMQGLIQRIMNYQKEIISWLYDGKYYVEMTLNDIYSIINEAKSNIAHFIDDYKITRPAIKIQYMSDILLGSKGMFKMYRDKWKYEILSDIWSKRTGLGSKERYSLGYWNLIHLGCGMIPGFESLTYDVLQINGQTQHEMIEFVRNFIIENYKVVIGDSPYTSNQDKALHAQLLASDLASMLILTAGFKHTEEKLSQARMDSLRDLFQIKCIPQSEYLDSFPHDELTTYGIKQDFGTHRMTFLKLINCLPKLQTLHQNFKRDITIEGKYDERTVEWSTGVKINTDGKVKLPPTDSKLIYGMVELEGAGVIGMRKQMIDNPWQDLYRIGKIHLDSTGYLPLHQRIYFGEPIYKDRIIDLAWVNNQVRDISENGSSVKFKWNIQLWNYKSNERYIAMMLKGTIRKKDSLWMRLGPNWSYYVQISDQDLMKKEEKIPHYFDEIYNILYFDSKETEEEVEESVLTIEQLKERAEKKIKEIKDKVKEKIKQVKENAESIIGGEDGEGETQTEGD
jgi:ElaB/YqjD/DUF883 family membrane-anchored ribosome-binding protein